MVLDKTSMMSNIVFYRNYLTLSVTAIGTLLLLPKLSGWRRSEGLIVKIITFVSLTSYSMYLLHYSLIKNLILPIAMKNIMYFPASVKQYEPIIFYLFYWLLTISFSYLLYRFFERPMTSLRNRWPSRDRHIVKAFVLVENQTETRTEPPVPTVQMKSG